MPKYKSSSKMSALFRLLLVESFLLAAFPIELPQIALAAAPATVTAKVQAAPAAATSTLHLEVTSARDELNWPGNQPGDPGYIAPAGVKKVPLFSTITL